MQDTHRPGGAVPRRALLFATAALAAPAAALAQAAGAVWTPTRPIRLVVPYPPGGATDVIARWVARELTPRIGQTVVVENRPGANGIIAMQHVQGAPPDGHTLVMTTADTVSVNPAVYRRLPYQPERFVPVAAVCQLVFALVVRQGFEARTAQEFVARAKAAARPITYATWGVASTSQVLMEGLRAEAGFEAQHIPFQGAGPAVQAMMAEQIDAMMMPVGLALAQGDRLRILGVASRARFAGAPAVPTLTEQGLRLTADLWMGVLGPPGVPEAVANRISEAVQGFVRTPEAAAFLQPNGMTADISDRAVFAATIRAEDADWRARAERLGVKLDD